MSLWSRFIATPTSLKLNKEEHSHVACMMLGMKVKGCAAPPGGAAPPCVGCGKPVDSCGHHLMTCNKTASFNAAHGRVQDTVSGMAQISNTTRVASTLGAGLPQEKPVGGKKADIAVTVVHA